MDCFSRLGGHLLNKPITLEGIASEVEAVLVGRTTEVHS